MTQSVDVDGFSVIIEEKGFSFTFTAKFHEGQEEAAKAAVTKLATIFHEEFRRQFLKSEAEYERRLRDTQIGRVDPKGIFG